MNNKGFTLVELLATIVLLAVITTIAVPSIMGISNNVKKNMLETKKDLMKENAKLYGEDNLTSLAASTKTLRRKGTNTGYKCQVLTIGSLVNDGYITLDEDDEEAGKVINPVDNSDMSDIKIIIYFKNKRVVAAYETEKEKNASGTEEEVSYSCR